MKITNIYQQKYLRNTKIVIEAGKIKREITYVEQQ